MNSIDIIRMTLKNLLRRKVRTLLTVVGVVIGTASIVIMISIGIGMNESFKNELSRMGSLNIINVRSGNEGGFMMGAEPVGGSARKQQKLDDKAVVILSRIAGVEAVVPIIETSGKLVSGKYVAYAQIIGVAPESCAILGLKAGNGRLLQKGDTLSMVFGSEMQNNFYKPGSSGSSGPPKIDLMKDKISFSLDMAYGEPIWGNSGDGIEMAKKPVGWAVKGVGVLEGGSYENNYNIFLPIDQLKKSIKEFNKGKKSNEALNIKNYSRIVVRVEDINNVQRVQQQIKDAGFYADSLTDILKSMQKTAAGIQMVLGAIGAVSLLVATIGITNTMVMSIYERTREIGIMKVIGSSLRDIKRLFLFESGMLGFLGGFIGVALSYGVSFLLNSAGFAVLNFYGPEGGGGKTSIIPLWLAASSMLFTSFIGLVSGYYPARRAMRLSALEAIKKE